MEILSILIGIIIIILIITFGFILRSNIIRNRKNIIHMYEVYELMIKNMVTRIDQPSQSDMDFNKKFENHKKQSWDKIMNSVKKEIGG